MACAPSRSGSSVEPSSVADSIRWRRSRSSGPPSSDRKRDRGRPHARCVSRQSKSRRGRDRGHVHGCRTATGYGSYPVWRSPTSPLPWSGPGHGDQASNRRLRAPGSRQRGPRSTNRTSSAGSARAERPCVSGSTSYEQRRKSSNGTKAIVGEKVGMTQVWDDQNRVVPVTVVKVAPCRVVQVKTPDSDGYSAAPGHLRHEEGPARSPSPRPATSPRRASSPGKKLVELRLDDASGYRSARRSRSTCSPPASRSTSPPSARARASPAS